MRPSSSNVETRRGGSTDQIRASPSPPPTTNLAPPGLHEQDQMEVLGHTNSRQMRDLALRRREFEDGRGERRRVKERDGVGRKRGIREWKEGKGGEEGLLEDISSASMQRLLMMKTKRIRTSRSHPNPTLSPFHPCRTSTDGYIRDLVRI